MPVEVIMPKVDMDMVRGKFALWHVGEGEAVAKGAPLFDIETDKSAMEVESPAAGSACIMSRPGRVRRLMLARPSPGFSPRERRWERQRPKLFRQARSRRLRNRRRKWL